uniref:mannan endo-1,4-beta-mannosidase n=1 Tax=Brassica oleracea var. oleracea TaxID=109376 RepID=A0A0D3E2P4_BRAOL
MKPLCLIIFLSIVIQQSYLKLGVDASSRDGFVRTKGVQFSLNGYPYYANGFNAYWLMYVASDPIQRPKISAAFQEASSHGLTVARTWAFSDGGYRPLQYSPGSYNEDMFQGLDFAIAEARKHGIKIILSFANNYVSFGGKKQYVDWARSQGRPVSSEDDFFTDSLVKDFYKNHIKAVLNRFNTFTKFQYKDDPTIMAWELMNEPRCPSDPTGRTIQAWITEMAAHVKSLDSNHLLEAGLEGFYGQSSPQSKTLNPPGQFGTDFIANNRIPGIDFVTAHSYPDEWFVDASEQFQMEFLNKWLDAHIQDAQNILRKPIILAEFGKSTKKAGYSPAQRDVVFNTVYTKIYESAKRGGAAAGGLFWQLLVNGMDNFQDGYGIILGQSSSTVNVIAQQSRKLTLIRKIFARMINVEKWKRARGYGPVREGASVSLLEKPVDKFVHQTRIPIQAVSFDTNYQLRQLIDSGNLRDARQVFDKMPHRDVFSWTAIIQGYVAATNYNEALILFSAMHLDPRVSADTHVLSVALKACGQSSNVSFGESLHSFAEKTSLLSSVFVGSALIDLYKRTGMIDKSCRVFSEMDFKNTVTWTTIITGLVHAGRHKEGLVYFTEMSRFRDLPDTFTFAIALKACACLRQLRYGQGIHTHVIVKGFGAVLCVANSLFTMYTECGEMEDALRLFESMSERDVVSWTSLITAYSRIGQEENAVNTFLLMRNSEVYPNEQTFASMFAACASLSRLVWGEQLHGNVFSLGIVDSLSVINSMMKMYSTCGKLDSASVLFRGMRCRDIISWSTIIGGYSQGGFVEEGFEYFSWMRQSGTKPTDFALASLLSVSGNMAVLEQGRQVHALSLHLGLEQNPTICSALITMYSKCGSIAEASKVFEETNIADIVALTAMTNGYAEHGKSKEAIDLFEKSLNVGFRPDVVTFISVLNACAHSGQLDLGFHYFNVMRERYNMSPAKEHYGCMVDLLCRAGRLSEAEKMIDEMPCEKDDVVWTTLLRACTAKRDIERGRRAAERMLELDPTSSTALVTLANIYSSTGKWKEAAIVRKSMKSKGVMKEPGWSSILIKDQVSAFASGGQSHPQCEDIYSILELVVHRYVCAIKGAFESTQICDP